MMVLNVWQISEFVSFIFSDFGQTEELHQPHPITTARLGDSVTLQCFHSLDLNKMTFYWYKQVLGGKPSPLAFSHPDGTSVKNKRASIQRTKESLHLTIKNINPSDEAVYFCGWNNDNNEIEFGNGSFLTLKSDSQHEPKTTAVIQIPVLHGDSVNLRCTVPYVNRSRAEETHPAVIYTHKNSRDQCEILSSTQSCVHNFFCRKIWFGNGTRLGTENITTDHGRINHLSAGLGASLIVCLLVLILTCLMYKKKRCSCCKTILNYAAIHFSKSKERRAWNGRQIPKDTIYSDIKAKT
uniref:Ig-like domain-containing protein n=1 Tax=Denticeps clupeoides TaxID=299321 RepID=A0AAY4EDE1_9TELE